MIAFTFIGAIIGAGFASGQEIRRFFVDYGIVGYLGFILVAFLFMLLGEKIMNMGYSSKADSYDKILGYAFRCKWKPFFDYLICCFFIATASTMFSGFGALCEQFFQIPFALGSLMMALISFGIVIFGINGVMKLSSVAVPVLILLTSYISLKSLAGTEFTQITHITEIRNISAIPVILSAVLYASYNLVLSISVLAALGANARDKSSMKKGSVISAITIFIFGSIIYFALFMNYGKIQGAEIPIAALTGPSQTWLYFISFFFAVLTTAISLLYGIYTRVGQNVKHFFVICVISYLLSLVGFSTLVAKLYTLMGVFGVFLLLMLLHGYRRSKKRI
ncbi:MAG: hypothetical protein J6M02_00590 [Clostridia bacterium]|nr:hypothetical protein [Clostridia bacterium]